MRRVTEALAIPLPVMRAVTATTEISVTALQILANTGGRSQRLAVDVVVTLVGETAAIDPAEIAEDAAALARPPIGSIDGYARSLADACLAHPAAARVEVRVTHPRALRNGTVGARVVLARG